MISTADHYDILGLGRAATQRDVKRSFYALLQQFPPEQKPREYQRLREAYDVLSNPVARQEYDSMSEYGTEIEALKKEAEDLMHADEPDYEGAIGRLKKAVVLGPRIGMLRNMLGICFLRKEAADKALSQFEAAVSIDPKNLTYRMNKGRALEDLGRPVEAEKVFRAAWAEDEEEYEAPRALASLLFKTDRVDEALGVLDKAILADGKVDFQDFFCYYDKLHFLLFSGRHDQLENELRTVVTIANMEAERSFAAFMLARTGMQLYELNAHALSHKFLAAASEIDPENDAIAEITVDAERYAVIDKGVEDIGNDKAYHDFVKHVVAIFAGRYTGRLEPGVFEERVREIVDVIPNIMSVDPDSSDIKRSIRKLKSDYPKVYEVGDKLLDVMASHPPADHVLLPCPHCKEKVRGAKGDRSFGYCPHCDGTIVYDGTAYRSTSAGRSAIANANGNIRQSHSGTDEGIPAWVWVVGVLFFLWMLGSC
jgi:tetratricopeptide (TPR) repeat protein